MAIVVDVVSPEGVTSTPASAPGEVRTVDVVSAASGPVTTVTRLESAIDVVRPGGTVVNVQYGTEFPPNPHEGMVFIKLQ